MVLTGNPFHLGCLSTYTSKEACIFSVVLWIEIKDNIILWNEDVSKTSMLEQNKYVRIQNGLAIQLHLSTSRQIMPNHKAYTYAPM